MEQSQEHLEADRDHDPIPDRDFYNCEICGLAVTADGKHHGFTDPYEIEGN